VEGCGERVGWVGWIVDLNWGIGVLVLVGIGKGAECNVCSWSFLLCAVSCFLRVNDGPSCVFSSFFFDPLAGGCLVYYYVR